MAGIYIHIPFCKQACSYCDFYFVTRKGYVEDFVKALIREIRAKENSPYTRETVQTIYLGGGTPSLLDAAQVQDILKAIDDTFRIEPKEITVEMNPDDVSRSYLNNLKSTGVNRVSMGVQSFNEQLLEFMNRAHTKAEALECLRLLQESGFEVYTVDLIYGNPGQSMEMLEDDLDTLLQFNPPHVSAYSLTIEPRTRLGKQVELGRLKPPDDDQVADHFERVVEKLASAGILQYEVSNYSLPGKEALHNASYWKHENYLGFGPGAHSFWWDSDSKGAYRWQIERDLKSYLKDGWKEKHEEEHLSLSRLAEERLMLGLRTRKGISRSVLKEQYDYTLTPEQEHYLQKQNKAISQDDRFHLSAEGLRIADTIILDLLTV